VIARGVYQVIKKKKLLRIMAKAEKKAVKKAAKKGKRSNTKVDRSDVSLIWSLIWPPSRDAKSDIAAAKAHGYPKAFSWARGKAGARDEEDTASYARIADAGSRAMRFFAFRIPTSSHRGIHQKINPSGINITTINAMTHSISDVLRGDKILVSRLLIRAVSLVSMPWAGHRRTGVGVLQCVGAGRRRELYLS
jgi:hypothetical protein